MIDTKAKGKKKDDKKVAENHTIEVTRAKAINEKEVIMFDMVVNGVTIYGCSYKTPKRKDTGEEFVAIGFPQRKGKDDKYYNNCYVFLSDEDKENIEKGIEAHLE